MEYRPLGSTGLKVSAVPQTLEERVLRQVEFLIDYAEPPMPVGGQM